MRAIALNGFLDFGSIPFIMRVIKVEWVMGMARARAALKGCLRQRGVISRRKTDRDRDRHRNTDTRPNFATANAVAKGART